MINLSRVLPFSSTCRLPLSSPRLSSHASCTPLPVAGRRCVHRAGTSGHCVARRTKAQLKNAYETWPGSFFNQSRVTQVYIYIYGLFANLFNMYGNRAREKGRGSPLFRRRGRVEREGDFWESSKPLTSVELARPLRGVVLLGCDKDNDKKMTRLIAR